MEENILHTKTEEPGEPVIKLNNFNEENFKTKVLLIAPKYLNTEDFNYNYTFPLGLAYVSSVLKNAGYDVTCFNMNHHKGKFEDILYNELNKEKYDFACTGHTGIGYSIVKKIIEIIRSHPSNPKVVLGGPIVTTEPTLIFNEFKPDFGIIGEAELTFLDLIDAVVKKRDLKKVNGIILRDDKGEIIITPARKPMPNINDVPIPDFDGFEFNRYLENTSPNDSYLNNPMDYPKIYPMLTSRACIFKCTFCYHADLYRERDLDAVMDEIALAIKKYNINMLMLYDDLFSYKKERIYEFCSRIKELGKTFGRELKWSCQLAVMTVDEPLLRAMKDSGCFVISYGFESVNANVLKSMIKPISKEQIDYALKTTLKCGISIQGNFIFGDVAETKESAWETLEYWKKEARGQIGLWLIQPYPGSQIYNICLKKGLIKDKLKFIRDDINTEEIVYNFTDKMTDEELMDLYEEIVKLRNSDKYCKSRIPYYVKHMHDDRYEVRVNCPYCKNNITYKNFYLPNKTSYNYFICCRNCAMRFRLVGPFIKILRSMSFIVPLLKKFKKKGRPIIISSKTASNS